jgi:putative intracellular protease/amidase
MKRKAVFIVPQIGFNDIELTTIRSRLEEKGIVCIIASYEKSEVMSKTKKVMLADAAIADLKAEEYDCFIFVGGEHVSVLSESRHVQDIVSNAYKLGKVIALLCLNPALILPKVNLLEGKSVTVFKTKDGWSERFISENGGILVDKPVVIDRNIVTCRNEEDAGLLADKLIEMLK